MSTKIYSAYKVNKNIDLTKLMQINYQIKEQIVSDFVNRMSIGLAKTVIKITNNLESSAKNEKYSESIRTLITKMLNNENNYAKMGEHLLYVYLWDEFSAKVKDNPDYSAKILYIPHNDDILAMFFGPYLYEKYIFDNDNFSDYHYQNQTDKPDDITDEDWEQREQDWSEAIGPDYIPINHGLEFTFLDCQSVDIDVRMSKEYDNAMKKLKEIHDDKN